MIDQACGVEPSALTKWIQERKRGTIELECSICGKKHTATRDKADPKTAVRAVFPCPKCWPDTDVSSFCGPEGELIPKYYDGDGNEVTPGWASQG